MPGLKQKLRKLPFWEDLSFLYRSIVPKFPYSSDTGPVPLTLLIELTNRCNLACLKCDNRSADVPRGDMDFSMLESLLDQAAKWRVPVVQFHFRGEPTLYKRLPEAVRAARERNLPTGVVTNGVLLVEELWVKLLSEGLSSVVVSIDAVDPETRDRLQPGAGAIQFENLKNLKPIRDKMGSKTIIKAHSVLTSGSRSLRMKLARNLIPHVDFLSQVYMYHFGAGLGGEKETELMHKLKPRSRPCDHLWRTAQVAWDGTINACCNDQKLLLKTGHIEQGGLAEIWNGEKYLLFRRLHLEKRFSEMPLCADCTFEYDRSWRHFRDRREIDRLNPGAFRENGF